ncbi:MAG: type II secretion system F family protein [Negativicutes bacterium]|nr:type II secretion system F family protein [Negativicutes bacterium]
MALVIAAAVFAATFTVILLIWTYAGSGKRGIVARLHQYVAAPQPVPAAGRALGERKLSGLRSLLRKLSKYFESPQWGRLIEHKLIQAGLPLKGSEFIAICMIAALSGAALLLALSGGRLGAAFSGMAAGLILPVLFLRLKIQRRLKAFNAQLGDALILIANSLRTGYSFLQAVEMVAREMPPPIAHEFSRLLKEMNLGVVAEDALNNMAKRMNSDDLDLVITAVVIQRQVGGNLAEILDNIAVTIRERVKIKGEIRTLTAQGRISGIIISALPVCIGGFIYLINPEYMRLLFVHPLGRLMLVLAVMSQVFGIIMIRRVVSIEV